MRIQFCTNTLREKKNLVSIPQTMYKSKQIKRKNKKKRLLCKMAQFLFIHNLKSKKKNTKICGVLSFIWIIRCIFAMEKGKNESKRSNILCVCACFFIVLADTVVIFTSLLFPFFREKKIHNFIF